jgi:hypothetical protein
MKATMKALFTLTAFAVASIARKFKRKPEKAPDKLPLSNRVEATEETLRYDIEDLLLP